MCQVIPFTLPCCRRTYVGVTRLPSCPANWPKSKCPPELCIQICYEPDDRPIGTCWRCKAEQAGVPPEHRERLRPGIDSADVVIGLEELGPGGRRKMVEEGGYCWFCGSRADCGEEDVEGGEKRAALRKRPVIDKRKLVNKRLKIESGGMRPRISAHPTLSVRNETHWQAQVPHIYDGNFGGLEFTHGQSPLSKPEQERDFNFNQYPQVTEYPAVAYTGQQPSTQRLQSQVSFANKGNGEKNNNTESEDMDDVMFSQMLEAYNNDPANHWEGICLESSPYSYPSPKAK